MNYSNRFIFYSGRNIINFNTYKRKYEVIAEVYPLVFLKAMSVSTVEKEFVVWITGG